jgi:hypothetical protein
LDQFAATMHELAPYIDLWKQARLKDMAHA